MQTPEGNGIMGIFDPENKAMKPKIRTKEKCPKCRGSFSYFDNGVVCPVCLTKPSTYYILLHWRGRMTKTYSDPNGHPLDSYKSAVNLRDAMQEEISRGMFNPDHYTPKRRGEFLGENQLKKFWEHKQTEGLAPTTMRSVRLFVFTYFIPFFKDVDVRELKTYHIDDFRTTLTDKNPKSQQSIMTYLRNWCHWLYRREVLGKVPVFESIKTPTHTIHYLATRDEQLKVVNLIPEEHRDFFTFSMDHPLRPSEVRCLKVKDFDTKEHKLLVQRSFSEKEERTRKNGKPVTIWLSENFNVKLLENKLPDAYVFTNPSTGQPYTSEFVRKLWRKARKKVGVTVTMYEGMRHSTASQALQAGVPLIVVSKALGHSNIDITAKRYAQIEFKATSAVVDRVVQIGEKVEEKSARYHLGK